jgi:hypothetical protein
MGANNELLVAIVIIFSSLHDLRKSRRRRGGVNSASLAM